MCDYPCREVLLLLLVVVVVEVLLLVVNISVCFCVYR